ncbi:MAG TPA: SAM-dependent methyltransferase [Lachnospiraceae bacterium]|nr:SAM-dependent methyltransferase [Lachnospiraceae bacterium]
MDLPEKFVENMKNILGTDFEDYEKSFEEGRFYGLRVNTLKISAEEFKAKGIFDLKNVTWCRDGFYYDEGIRPAKHPYYHAGLYYLQEPSAMSPAEVLKPKKGDKVLDLCAAPGGKTTQLGASLGGTGVLIANDISAGRTKALLKNVELFGITNCIVMSETPEKLSKSFGGYFDKILVDAPCSGEGMFRKEPDVMKSWNEDMLEFCQKSQRDILESSAKMLKRGGLILYSTCTFSPQENEKSINDFLTEHEEFELLPIDKEFDFANGNPDWVDGGRAELVYTKRLWPHKIKGEGHFLALLHKKEADENTLFVWEEEKTDDRMKYFEEFKAEVLDVQFCGIYQIINDSLYLLPHEVPVLKGIRVMRSGWLLGEFKKNRFEPSQALAMGLKKNDIKRVVDFDVDDQRVIRYLKGETVEAQCENGWCVVMCDGYPLGWAKAQQGRLKNKYSTGWRM